MLELLNILPQPTILVIISSFAGALIGEFNREVNDDVPCSILKFIANFFASWFIGAATSLLIQSIVGLTKGEVIFAVSAVFGYVGHKESVNIIKNLILTKFCGKEDKDREDE